MARYVLVKEEVAPENLEGEEDEEVGRDEHGALLGNAMDSEAARDRWIDAVERLMEEAAFENGEVHSRRNFDEVRYDGDYCLGGELYR